MDLPFDFLFELLGEIIFEPILAAYAWAMSAFTKGSKKADEKKVRYLVAFEVIALFSRLLSAAFCFLKPAAQANGAGHCL